MTPANNINNEDNSGKKLDIAALSKLLRHAQTDNEIAEATKIWLDEAAKASKVGDQSRLNMLLGAIGRVTFSRSAALELQQLYYQARLHGLAKQFEGAEAAYRKGLAYTEPRLSDTHSTATTETLPLSEILYWHTTFTIALANTLASRPSAATNEAELLLNTLAASPSFEPILNKDELAWQYHFALTIRWAKQT
jgi:hypothetical protein